MSFKALDTGGSLVPISPDTMLGDLPTGPGSVPVLYIFESPPQASAPHRRTTTTERDRKRAREDEKDVFTAIREVLGEPYVEIPKRCLLYRMDCLEAMKSLNAAVPECVNLTVTSPPYNIGKAYEEVMPLEEYLTWCGEWMAEIYALTKPDGALWLNLGYLSVPNKGKAVPLSYLLWDRASKFFLQQEVVWHYGAGVAARKYLSPRNEKFLWYVKDPKHYTFNLDDIRDPNVKYPNQKKNGKIRVNPRGKNPSDVWIIPKVTSGRGRKSKERTPHPAQFPVRVIERTIKGSSEAGDLVLDPFMGSGTTAEVALLHGRRVLGFEIREDYCAMAKARIEAAGKASSQQQQQQQSKLVGFKGEKKAKTGE